MRALANEFSLHSLLGGEERPVPVKGKTGNSPNGYELQEFDPYEWSLNFPKSWEQPESPNLWVCRWKRGVPRVVCRVPRVLCQHRWLQLIGHSTAVESKRHQADSETYDADPREEVSGRMKIARQRSTRARRSDSSRVRHDRGKSSTALGCRCCKSG